MVLTRLTLECHVLESRRKSPAGNIWRTGPSLHSMNQPNAREERGAAKPEKTREAGPRNPTQLRGGGTQLFPDFDLVFIMESSIVVVANNICFLTGNLEPD